MSAALTAARAEAEVEDARAALHATLNQLKDNLQPRHLVAEVMARPRDRVAGWLLTYARFAKRSPVSGLIIGAAALAITTTVARGKAKPRSVKLDRLNGRRPSPRR